MIVKASPKLYLGALFACNPAALSACDNLCERRLSIVASAKMQWVSLCFHIIQDIYRVPDAEAALFHGSWRQGVRWIFEACRIPILD